MSFLNLQPVRFNLHNNNGKLHLWSYGVGWAEPLQNLA